MPRVTRTSLAELDLLDILERIAEADPTAAARLATRLDKICLRLADFPFLGTSCEMYGAGLRYFTVQRNFVIFYVPLSDGIEVRRVVRGARDFPSLFSDPEASQDS